MTDSSEPAESPEIEEVRRLLADARHTEPMPADVAARMDDVLAGLGSTPAAAASSSPARTPVQEKDTPSVVSLAAHRRRRAAGMLVAAAAVVVGGVVVAQNLPESTSSSESASTTSGGDSAALGSKPARTPRPENPSGEDARLGGAPKPLLKDGSLVVRPRRFSVDALAGQQLLRKKALDSQSSAAPACAAVPTDDGTVLRATYQRAPAALVYRPASGGSQVVDLYVCGSHRPVRTATLPAP